MSDRTDTQPKPSAEETARREAIHDLRNLFGIVMSAKHVLEREPDGAQRIALLEAIEDAAVRGGALTTDLLAPPQGRSRALDVGERLAELVPMMRALVGPRISFDLQIGFPEAKARVDCAAFDAAMLELIANAGAADARGIQVRSRKVGTRLWILVSDDGRGMPPPALARARLGSVAEGAHGLGLPRILGFVRASHGQMLVRSRMGSGTTVAIILPAILAATLNATPAPSGTALDRVRRKLPARIRQAATA